MPLVTPTPLQVGHKDAPTMVRGRVRPHWSSRRHEPVTFAQDFGAHVAWYMKAVSVCIKRRSGGEAWKGG